MKNDVVKEYVSRLSEDNLKNLADRFKQNLFGDRAEIAKILSESRDVDRYLASAKSCDEWFEMVDGIGELVLKRCEENETLAAK